MEQNPQQPNEQIIEQESVFNEAEILGSGYDKNEKRARNVLFIIAGIQIISGFFTMSMYPNADPTFVWAQVGIIAAIYVALGFWCMKNPFYAILVGLILYVLYQVFLGIDNPKSIFMGIPVKAIIIVFLIIGFRSANEAKKIKDALRNK